ncbi:MAG: dTDP-4-dehydrorhamnose 3,5-epimerase [Chloroflexi bacterium]|nr:dTDP-4-dehydrorhamnose 3,5-epimerase [Chloroflexota bacterium]
MYVRPGKIEGLFIIERPTFGDDRGFFRESFRLNELEEARGAPATFVQENHSRSHRGALRGLHFENWEKLVYVPHGEVFTALADIRQGSPTLGCVETFVLGESNRLKLFLPAAIAHGFCVLSEDADYVYQVTSYWDGSDTRAVAWNDPDLAVPWPISHPTISDRDIRAPSLRELLPEVAAAIQRQARGSTG